MARSQESFGKKEKEKKRLKKRKEKDLKREERKSHSKKGEGFDSMIAYVDEFGQITDTPPDPTKKREEVDIESIDISIPKKLESDGPSVFTGKVEFFNDSKGYGFIRELDTQEKYFVHINGLLEEVKEGDKVTFELEKGLKGMNAVKVKKVTKK